MVSQRWVKFVGTVGAVANWGIPMAAILNIYNERDPSLIDPKMTGALCVYSIFFMRWSLAIKPTNYPLFVCHAANEVAQLAELSRWAMYRTGIYPSKKTPKTETK